MPQFLFLGFESDDHLPILRYLDITNPIHTLVLSPRALSFTIRVFTHVPIFGDGIGFDPDHPELHRLQPQLEGGQETKML